MLPSPLPSRTEINRALNRDMHFMEIYVSPLQTEEFATPQPGRNSEHNHQPGLWIQLEPESPEFRFGSSTTGILAIG